MVIVKVLKNQNMLFKALSMGLENAFVCNVIVDKETVATLQPGEETVVEMALGSHKVVFKDARLGGQKSNKLVINITPDSNYIIQVQRGINGFVASYTTLMDSICNNSVKCSNCGALNKVIGANTAKCEYCDSLLN